ncbi:Ty-3/Gypsy retrotransposon polyprotein, partial [Trifolium medium]|nr:Ty-3/Gypsy retrotransposon polyprotein [Trifolium medium]
MSTSYHPETDGQTEVVNRCLETYLRCFISDQPKNWSNWLSWGEYWFNTNYHASTDKTPYEIVYGRVPPVITRWVQGETRVAAVQKELMDRDEALKQLRDQLLRAQDRMKQLADKKRCDRSFEVGEWVFVKLRAHRQQSVVCRINAKLAARYYGPYPVVARIGAVAYQLKLPEGSRVLIHWKGQGAEEATWEDVIMMKSQFPNLCLEDKAVNSGGSVVRTQNINLDSNTSLIQSSVGPRVWK